MPIRRASGKRLLTRRQGRARSPHRGHRRRCTAGEPREHLLNDMPPVLFLHIDKPQQTGGATNSAWSHVHKIPLSEQAPELCMRQLPSIEHPLDPLFSDSQPVEPSRKPCYTAGSRRTPCYRSTRCPFHKYTASSCGLASFPRKRESRRRAPWGLDARRSLPSRRRGRA